MKTAFLIVYGALVRLYLFVARRGHHGWRAVTKISLVVRFLLAGFTGILTHPPVGGMGVLFLVALVFCALGDVLLLWFFNAGGTAFGIGNVLFFVYELRLLLQGGFQFRDFWWCIFIFLVPLYLLYHFLFTKGVREAHHGIEFQLTGYLISIAMHGTMGVLLIIFFPGTPSFWLGLGSLLFWISDMYLMFYKFRFHDKKWILNLNSLNYFVGMLLIAGSRHLV